MNINPITQKISCQTQKIMRQIKPSQFVLPTVTIPLVCYYIGENQDKAAADILNFFYRKNIKVPDFLRPHADTKCGFNAASKTKIKKALQEAYKKGQITEEERDKYTNKLTFAGHGDAEGSVPSNNDSVTSNNDYDTDTDIPADDCDTGIDAADDDSIIDAILDFFDDLF